MRVIFAGTPEFASMALAQLHAAGHEMVLVLTQPDRPAGRGMKLQASAVKQFALAHDIAVAQPRSLRLDGKFPDDAQAAQTAIAQAQADVMIVAAYGLILPQWVLDAPRHGCLNIHASLLPRWRGAAPIHRAIEAGDAITGVTIMQMDAGLDTGNMLLCQALPIQQSDTTAVLHDKLADLGGRMIVQALTQVGRFEPQVQPGEGVTYAHKIEKAEANVDWAWSAAVMERRVRAFDPFPGVSCVMHSTGGAGGAGTAGATKEATKGTTQAETEGVTETVKLWQAEVITRQSHDGTPKSAPGTVLSADAQGLCVACGQGALRITQLQRPGGKRISAVDFLRGFPLRVGQPLCAAA
jgi:methionyl-tRNA formyltransferase